MGKWKIDFGNPVMCDDPCYRNYNIERPYFPNAKLIKMTTGTHDEGLGFDVEHKPEIKQYGVNDLSPVSETPVFNEGMKRLAKLLNDAAMNPIHGNQAGSDAYVKAMQELEWKEIRKEAEKLYGDDPNNWGGQRDGYVKGVIAERSRLHPLLLHSEQKLRDSTRLLELAGQRIKELEEWKRQAIEVAPPLQDIAKIIGVKLGQSIHDKILPAIERLTLERDIANGRIKELETELFSIKSMQSE